MERRNYTAIFLLVFGIIGVYSHPQRSDAQDVFSTVESLKIFYNDQLTDYSVNANENHGDGRTRRDVKLSASKKLQLLSNAMREFRLRDPATMNSAEAAHQENMRFFIDLVQARLTTGTPQNIAIDLVTTHNRRLADRIAQYMREHPRNVNGNH